MHEVLSFRRLRSFLMWVGAGLVVVSSTVHAAGLRLEAFVEPGGGARLRWEPGDGPAVHLEWSTNLAYRAWFRAGTNLFSSRELGAVREAVDLRANLPQVFYRLRREPTFVPMGGPTYEIGDVVYEDRWVDPVSGDDENDGTRRDRAVRTLLRAWQNLPEQPRSNTGIRIRLVPGLYRGGYLESRHGTAVAPILIEPADGPGTVFFAPVDDNGANVVFFDCSYVYLQDFGIAAAGGDALQFDRCHHVLVRRMDISSVRMDAQNETVKINQSQHVYIEDSDIHGAGDNPIDAVAVQYGHVVRSRIHDGNDWGFYLKGGSAYFRVEANLIHDCGTGGFTAGQGTGFQFMVPPWIHYEAYDIKVVNNILHDIEGAGLGVNGGYNILMAQNTLYRVGARSHAIEVVHGRRGCDGGRADLCQPLLDQGGWGTTGDEEQIIPNRNVFIYNNVLLNPAGFRSEFQHFEIRSGVVPPPGSNLPNPSRADDHLQIRGNVLWNGPADMALGIEEEDRGCQPGNTACNLEQLRRENAINTSEPLLIDPANGDFRPLPGGALALRQATPVPEFGWSDAPTRPAVPAGNLDNRVPRTITGSLRPLGAPPGAF